MDARYRKEIDGTVIEFVRNTTERRIFAEILQSDEHVLSAFEGKFAEGDDGIWFLPVFPRRNVIVLTTKRIVFLQGESHESHNLSQIEGMTEGKRLKLLMKNGNDFEIYNCYPPEKVSEFHAKLKEAKGFQKP